MEAPAITRGADEPSGVADEIRRGVMRLFWSMGEQPLAEVTLATGRRLDLLVLARDGTLTAVEIKSCRADFTSDAKWPDYLAWADRFYFAVDPSFPIEILPELEGLIVADRYGGEILRGPTPRPLPAARRRALTLRFARIAAARAHGLADPDLGIDLPMR